MANKYCYAIVNKNTGNLAILSEKLPIFWYKKVAQEQCDAHLGGKYVVVRLDLDDLKDQIQWNWLKAPLKVTT